MGASFDSVADNAAFARDQDFTFPLLSDIDQQIGRAYRVIRPDGDRLAAFPQRHAYLIDPDGRIAAAYDVTDVAAHASQVLVDLTRLQATR